MEFPFGHHRHQYRDDFEQESRPPQPPYPYPPPSTYPPLSNYPPPPPGPYEDQPPPYPPHGNAAYPPPPPSSEFTNSPYGGSSYSADPQNYPPPQTYPSYPPDPPHHHSAYPEQHHHEPHGSYPNPPHQSSLESAGGDDGEDHRHHFRPHMPSFVESHIHHSSSSSHGQGDHDDLAGKPSVKVYCKAEANYSLAIRDGQVILAPSNPDDPSQHWVKDEKYSTKVKDRDGFPCFALVNKATGQVIKHSIGATQPVQLAPYNPDKLDQSVLWTMGKDIGEGYRTIRMVNNTKLMLDAFNGDKKHGGVHDGTTVVVWEWKTGDNQRWKIVRY